VFQCQKRCHLESRRKYYHWFKSFTRDQGIDVLDKVFFSDEACLNLNGYVNNQNSRHYSTDHPHVLQEQQLHPIKVGVWCAISRRRIVRPLFFHNTIDGTVYRELITQFITLLNTDERVCWFQQDGQHAIRQMKH